MIISSLIFCLIFFCSLYQLTFLGALPLFHLLSSPHPPSCSLQQILVKSFWDFSLAYQLTAFSFYLILQSQLHHGHQQKWLHILPISLEDFFFSHFCFWVLNFHFCFFSSKIFLSWLYSCSCSHVQDQWLEAKLIFSLIQPILLLRQSVFALV